MLREGGRLSDEVAGSTGAARAFTPLPRGVGLGFGRLGLRSGLALSGMRNMPSVQMTRDEMWDDRIEARYKTRV